MGQTSFWKWGQCCYFFYPTDENEKYVAGDEVPGVVGRAVVLSKCDC